MIKITHILFVLVLNIFSLSVSCQIRDSLNKISTEPQKKDSIISLFSEWKVDSLGCLGYRQSHVSYVISFIYNEINNPEDIYYYLGIPNQQHYNEITDSKNLIYYIEAFCENNVVVEDTDVSWLLIAFRVKGFSGFTVFIE